MHKHKGGVDGEWEDDKAEGWGTAILRFETLISKGRRPKYYGPVAQGRKSRLKDTDAATSNSDIEALVSVSIGWGPLAPGDQDKADFRS